MSPTGLYSVYMNATSVSGAITLVQIKAASNYNVEILRAWCSQSSSTTSTMQKIQVLRKTAAATVTSFTPIVWTGAQAAKAVGGTAATGFNASGEGTDGDILWPDSFNILNGWEKIWVPEERPICPSGGFIALKFPTAPGGATTYNAGFTFQEIG